MAFLAVTINSYATESPDYVVGTGDILSVRVLGEEDFSGQFRVANDGMIDYPYVRRIEARGRTLKELGDHIATLLKEGYLVDPHVMVEMKEYHSQKVLVLGAVTKPGTYVLKGNTRILDLISQAGGISQSGGKRILLLREKSDASPAEGKTNEAPVVSTLDDQNQPSRKADSDNNLSVVVSKHAEPRIVDYHRLVHEGDLTENYVLQNGDILNIPKANEIFIFGNVARPGPVKYEDGMTILQAITLAGGPTPEASTRATYILRRTEKGESKINVRLDRIIDNKAKNVPLMANDVIHVPESFF